MRFEQPRPEVPKRISFAEASEDEKILRYEQLSRVLDHEAAVSRFVTTAYRHLDRFALPAGATSESFGHTLSQANEGVSIIRAYLHLFRDLKAGETTTRSPLASLAEVEGAAHASGQFFRRDRRQIDSHRLTDLLRWCLEATLAGSKAIGGVQPKYTLGDIPNLVSDLESILDHVAQNSAFSDDGRYCAKSRSNSI